MQTKLGKKNRKIGRHAKSLKNARYKSQQHREKNKLKRILQSNGIDATTLYAAQHNLHEFARKLVAARSPQ